MEPEFQYFHNVKLFERFLKEASPEQITMVNKNINHCMPLLDQYYKAFPTYTLHNFKHQENILILIGKLLGNDLEKLSTLEMAILILCTIYHDIGMVFSNEDLKRIESEASFSQFINDNYNAKLKYQEANLLINNDLAQWYCRWVHAARVWQFLQHEEQVWGKLPLRPSIGHICESHVYKATLLVDDSKYATDFLGDADLRFCAILLRVADILDFDNSRSPKSVYEFLELDAPKNKNEQISHDEWNKHLCSEGFIIDHRDGNINLRFLAAPEHPQIENNIETFLNVIEDELKICGSVVTKCSEKWRDYKLPRIIDMSGIIPVNYKKGNYKLSLDENKIIKLLTGENLYYSGLVFIRELLQNAIDTSRMRVFHEVSQGNHPFKAKPIEVNIWVDNQGYTWVRVDDFGMGINEHVITNHLLKKGNSYYGSDYFKIQKRYYKEKLGMDFTPISRFGIGLLSCFILGDSVEISSRAISIPQTSSEEEKIRLSIQGLQSHYYFQTKEERNQPLEMPNYLSNEKEFRKEYGTTVAVRISRNKDYLGFQNSVKNIIKHFITCSPIDIFCGKELENIDFDTTLNKTLTTNKFHPFSDNEKKQIAEVIEKEITGDIGIQVLPIDMSAISKNPNFKGQIVFLFLKSDDFKTEEAFYNWEFRFSLFEKNNMNIKFSKKHINQETKKEENKEIEINLQSIFDTSFDMDRFNRIFLEDGDNSHYTNRLKIIHNGINVPNFSDRFYYNSSPKIEFYQTLFTPKTYGYRHDSQLGCFGIIYLQDSLIPDLSVARNTIKKLNFNVYSSLFFSVKELNDHILTSRYFYDFLQNVDEDFNLEEIASDDLVITGQWDTESLISTEFGLISISEVKKRLKEGDVRFKSHYSKSFLDALSKALIEINFEVVYVIDENDKSHFLIKSIKNKIDLKEGAEYYPLLFVAFNNDNILAHSHHINTNHWLGDWIFSQRGYLMVEFEIYFSILIRYILETNIKEVNLILDYFNKILSNKTLPINRFISESDFNSPKAPF